MRALLILCALAAPALADEPAKKPPHPCPTDPRYRQLDFWIGEWTVTGPKGKVAGTSKIERILDGCVILENWTDSHGSSGKSFNIFDQRDNQWHQTWVEDTGDQQVFHGQL